MNDAQGNGATAKRLVTTSGMCDFSYLTEGFCNPYPVPPGASPLKGLGRRDGAGSSM